jgi:hypothetical protein
MPASRFFAEYRDQDHPVLDTHPKQGDETNPSRNTEVDARNMQGQYATYQREWYVQNNQRGILNITKRNEQDQEDNQ